MADLTLYVGAFVFLPSTMKELSSSYDGCPKCKISLPNEYNFCYKCGCAKGEISRKYTGSEMLDIQKLLRDCHAKHILRVAVNYTSSAVLLPEQEFLYDCGTCYNPPFSAKLVADEVHEMFEQRTKMFMQKPYLRQAFEELKKNIPKTVLNYGLVWFNPDEDWG